jgi:hypothetical protein
LYRISIGFILHCIVASGYRLCAEIIKIAYGFVMNWMGNLLSLIGKVFETQNIGGAKELGVLCE